MHKKSLFARVQSSHFPNRQCLVWNILQRFKRTILFEGTVNGQAYWDIQGTSILYVISTHGSKECLFYFNKMVLRHTTTLRAGLTGWKYERNRWSANKFHTHSPDLTPVDFYFCGIMKVTLSAFEKKLKWHMQQSSWTFWATLPKQQFAEQITTIRSISCNFALKLTHIISVMP